MDQARGENTHTIKLSPHYQNMLNDHHAGTDISKKREGTAEGVGIAAARRVSIDNADFPELTAEYRVSSRVNQVFSEVMAKRRAKNKKNRKPTTTTTTTDDDDDKPDVASTSTPPFPHPASSEHSEVSPKSAWVKKPTYKLQVGEQLKGTLRSADGRSALWPGVDGSLRFGVFLTPDGGKSGKGGVGFGVMEETSLLPSESDKALEALLLRRELQLEGEGGRGGERENEEGRVVGNWWSLRQASKQRQREIAAENEGEVCVSVSDKGCVVSQSKRFRVYRVIRHSCRARTQQQEQTKKLGVHSFCFESCTEIARKLPFLRIFWSRYLSGKYNRYVQVFFTATMLPYIV